MKVAFLYGAALAAFIVLVVCHGVCSVLMARCIKYFRSYVLYPLVRNRSRHVDNITRLNLISLLIFLGLNSLVLSWTPHDRNTLSQRASITSLFNLIPLFLGGKTNPLMSFVGFPLSTYYFSHHWFGRVATAEALIHIGLSVSTSRSNDNISISGYIVGSALITITILSLWFVRRAQYDLFLKAHVALSLLALGTAIWHVHLTNQSCPKVAIYCAASLWGFTIIFRFLRSLYYGLITVDTWQDKQALRMQVRLRRPTKVYPGSYFYLYFPVAPFRFKIRGYPMNVAWWNVADVEGSGYSSELLFLIYHRGSVSSLAERDGNVRKIFVDGPYGQNLSLHEYENIILTAKGPGIVGIIPHALHLAGRRLHDERQRVMEEAYSNHTLYRDKTRKVDMFWVLEDNSQQRWLHNELRTLQKLDPRNRLLRIWCIYPSPRRRGPPFEQNDYWRCFYPSPGSDFHQNGIVREIGVGANSPGRSIVVACGEPSFTGQIRDEVIRNASMEFVEVEYRPTYSAQELYGNSKQPRKQRTRRDLESAG
ncbi:hypothetical protein F4805DRAFT_12125 [Annulohypoxylon moriforme]|nr:hypothetical protein F4805DRAFT_12125 [Annulohypoxylon moriforme]